MGININKQKEIISDNFIKIMVQPAYEKLNELKKI